MTALVAQAVGRQDATGADQVAGTAMSFGIVVGCVVVFAVAFVVTRVMRGRSSGARSGKGLRD